MNTFMGIPFEADEIYKGYKNTTAQWGMKEFQGLVQPILDKGVDIRWTQYTPYFNDGDPCEFGINEPEFRFERPAETDDDEDDYDREGFYDEWDLRYNESEYLKHPAYTHLKQLIGDWGHFEHLLYETFGDHAEVTVTPEKVIKESYYHD